MALNPMQLLQLKERFSVFQTQHPKIMPFLNTAKTRIDVGTTIEIKITTSEGKKMTAGLKVTQEDVKTLHMLMQ